MSSSAAIDPTPQLKRIIIHGGYINESNIETKPYRQASLNRILQHAYAYLQDHTALETVVYTVSLLEDDPLFNAGTGSRIQSDGVIRMSAALMDSETRKFSGVINISDVQNPIQVACALRKEDDRVLADQHATRYAHANGFPSYDPEIEIRRVEFDKWAAAQHYSRQEQSGVYAASLTANKTNADQQATTTTTTCGTNKTGTVGCVILKGDQICVGTSTGGKGMEIPGRVSDSATIAGTFCNAYAGVSVTGVGEDAISAGLASAIATRRADGVTLDAAVNKTIGELQEFGGISGAIAIDIDGHICHRESVPSMVYGYHDGSKIVIFE